MKFQVFHQSQSIFDFSKAPATSYPPEGKHKEPPTKRAIHIHIFERYGRGYWFTILYDEQAHIYFYYGFFLQVNICTILLTFGRKC